MSEVTEPAEAKQPLLGDTKAKSEQTGKASNTFPNIDIKEFDVGVWHLKVALPRRRFSVKHYIDAITSSIPLVELSIKTGTPDVYGILFTILVRFWYTLLSVYISMHSRSVQRKLISRVSSHFELYLMNARLRLDLPTSLESMGKERGNCHNATAALEGIVIFLMGMLSTASHIALIYNLSHSVNSPLFAIICIAQPLFASLWTSSFWDKAFTADVINDFHKRLRSLRMFANSDTFHQDIISSNLGSWIMQEYHKAVDGLGDVRTGHPIGLLEEQQKNSRFLIFQRLLGDLPMIYCALCVIFLPSKFSIASIAMLQQSAFGLRSSIENVLQMSEKFRRDVANIKQLYSAENAVNLVKDSTITYPSPEEKEAGPGMALDLQDVTFAYPGSKTGTPALSSISLSIRPGQLVIVVGTNGSGKSTLVRLLCRLYDPTSGQILINGRSSKSYRLYDLRQATAILSQDNQIYPLSLRENIGLGFPEAFDDNEAIIRAAKNGGAWSAIERLKDGLDTNLEATDFTDSWSFGIDPSHPLYQNTKKREKKADLSGGEKQRVVAARTFMRFNSGKIKFVAVDEPSSALDAEGELQLFDNLIAVREGKTMVFVTHRFGHLTRHADQIICMKDGTIAEVGTHEELTQKDGEYSKLYKIQAKAFASDVTRKATVEETPQE